MRTSLEHISDEELVKVIARDSSDEACTELFGRYNKKIYMWCFSYTHDVDEALDCAQEILIRVFKNAGFFLFRSSLSTWIYKITRNYCLGEATSRKRQWYSRMLVLDEYFDAGMVEDDPGKKVEISEDIERFIEKARDVMTDDELEAFILHYYEGMRVREITAILSCDNLTGARTLIQNARRKFKRIVGER